MLAWPQLFEDDALICPALRLSTHSCRGVEVPCPFCYHRNPGLTFWSILTGSSASQPCLPQLVSSPQPHLCAVHIQEFRTCQQPSHAGRGFLLPPVGLLTSGTSEGPPPHLVQMLVLLHISLSPFSDSSTGLRWQDVMNKQAITQTSSHYGHNMAHSTPFPRGLKGKYANISHIMKYH